MNLFLEKARNLMVENQLRPNRINDGIILDLFRNTKKEDFLRDDLKKIAYSDIDIDLIENRGYLKNLHIAQLIQGSEIKKNYKILHIGGLTGYISLILSNLCKELIVIENHEDLNLIIEEKIRDHNINKNIKFYKSELNKGCAEEAPYDLIFIDNPIRDIPKILFNQLNADAGKIIMVKKIDQYLSQAHLITKKNDNYTDSYLFDIFTNYELYKHKGEFVF